MDDELAGPWEGFLANFFATTSAKNMVSVGRRSRRGINEILSREIG